MYFIILFLTNIKTFLYLTILKFVFYSTGSTGYIPIGALTPGYGGVDSFGSFGSVVGG